MKTVFMFPGQGAQHVGMGQSLLEKYPQAKEIYEQGSEIVGYDLAKLCFEGPEDKLNSTEFSQPAIFATSAAYLKALNAGILDESLKDFQPDTCLGLSLGEYNALYAAGAMSFEEGLKLVQLRGKSMQEAAGLRAGTMVSVMGLEEEQVNKLCSAVLAEGISEDDGLEPLLEPVNFNCPGQIVISGSIKACEKAAELAESFGASNAVRLNVIGAFHSPMMQAAAEKLRAALDNCNFRDLASPVVANVDAKYYQGPGEITEKLMQQLVSAVRFQQSVELLMEEGVERFIEIGPGRVLTGLVKRTGRAQKKKLDIVTTSQLG